MPVPIVLLDACVLYPAPLRDLLLRLALAGLYHARWTDAIHDEWTRNVLANVPGVTAQKLARTRRLMDAHAPGCLVAGYQVHVAYLTLPDADDRHVLAAAIQAEATIIVTWNTRHFPASALKPHGVRAEKPDNFVTDLIATNLDSVIAAVNAQRLGMKSPPATAADLFAILNKQGLTKTVALLGPHKARL